MNVHTMQNLPEGWKFRDTPGHGYLIPSADANNNVPKFLRESEYEEDCAYSIPIVFNANLFTAETVKSCTNTFKNWYPKEYEKAFKVTLKEGESSVKDGYYFERLNNVGKFEKSAGFGSWCYQVPEGYVYAILKEVLPTDVNCEISRATGKEITCLITEDLYRSQSCFELNQVIPFVRDETYYTWESFEKAGGTRFNMFPKVLTVASR